MTNESGKNSSYTDESLCAQAAAGDRTAEEIKVHIGSACPRPEEKYINVKGRCQTQGLPKAIRLCASEMTVALDEPVSAIIEAVCSVV